jgi:type IV pilus assembly protein PilO
VSRRDRNILLLGLLVIVLVAVVYYFLLLGPLLNNLGEQAQERSDKEAHLANVQQQVAQLEAVKRNAPETERQVLELSKRIPNQPEIPSLVVQIEQIADAAGVTQLSIQPGAPGPPPGGGNFSVVPITMRFEGTYEQLQDFLSKTSDLVRLVTVKDVTYCRIPPLDQQHSCPIEVAGTAGGEGTVVEGVEAHLQVEIKAEVYFQPSPGSSEVPAGTPPVALETTQEITGAEVGAR